MLAGFIFWTSYNSIMTFFDIAFYSVFNYFKNRQKSNANSLAIYYITCLHIALLCLIGVFLMLFLNELNVSGLSKDKAWVLLILSSFIIYFRNWIQYSGKKRKVLNLKLNQTKDTIYNVWLLLSLPIVCIVLTLIIWSKL